MTINEERASNGRNKEDHFTLAIVDKDIREILDFCADIETIPDDILTGLSYFELRDGSNYLWMSFVDEQVRDYWLEEAEALGFKVLTEEPEVSALVRQSRVAFVGNFSHKFLDVT